MVEIHSEHFSLPPHGRSLHFPPLQIFLNFFFIWFILLNASFYSSWMIRSHLVFFISLTIYIHSTHTKFVSDKTKIKELKYFITHSDWHVLKPIFFLIYKNKYNFKFIKYLYNKNSNNIYWYKLSNFTYSEQNFVNALNRYQEIIITSKTWWMLSDITGSQIPGDKRVVHPAWASQLPRGAAYKPMASFPFENI